MARYNTVGKVATSITKEIGVTFVKYHDTVVVEFSATHIRLDSGGWRTATTKVRMNQAANQFGLNYSVYQDKGVWYVRRGDVVLLFQDGMILPRG